MADYVNRIIDLAGLFPIYLQIACSCLFDLRLDDPDGEPDWGQVTGAFFEEAAPHFEFAWGRLQPLEQDNLARIATDRSVPKDQVRLNAGLRSIGLLVGDGREFGLFGSAFRDFVLAQGASKPGKPSIVKRLFGRGR